MRISGIMMAAAIALGIAAQPSFAVEMPLKAPAHVASAYNWSGFYVGGNVGYGWSTADWTNEDDTTLFGDAVPPDSFSNRMTGLVGGGQIGFNFQNGNWVLGVEAMLDAAGLKGSQTSTFGAADDQFESRLKALMLFTGRAGYAWNNVLAYAKAGLAVADIEASAADNVGPNTGSGSDSQWLAGLTVGVGFEYGVTPNLSVALEYDYIHLNSASYQLGDSTGSYRWNVGVSDINLVLAKLNYRFNGLH